MVKLELDMLAAVVVDRTFTVSSVSKPPSSAIAFELRAFRARKFEVFFFFISPANKLAS